MAGLTLDDLDPTYAPGTGPSGHTLLYPPDGVTGLAPVHLNTSMDTLQRQLFQQNHFLHDMKQAFDAEVLSLQAEQQQVQQDNVHLLHRLNTLPTPLPSGSPLRLDFPTFGSEDETVNSKLGLHEFDAWRVQVVEWHAESTLAVSTRNVQVFTKLRGRAARVVAAMMPLDALCTSQGFQGLLGILEWAYGGDTADNILQAVVGLLECKRGDSEMLAWINRLDVLVYGLANFGIVLDQRFSGTMALLNSNLNADQRAMVVASTGRSLVFSQVLIAIRQLFPGRSTSNSINCMFGAEAQRRGNNKTPTGNEAGTAGGSRVTCWKCAKRGHVQCDCPEKTMSASTLMAQDASSEEEGLSRTVPAAENKSGGAGMREVLSVVGHDTTVDLFHNPGVCLMAQSGQLSSPLHKLCSECLGRGIIDLGCTDTMCGEFWLRHYLPKLGTDRADIRGCDSNAWFVFGDGGTKSALYRVDLPLQIGGRVQFLSTQWVSGETPLLIGGRSFSRMRMRIDRRITQLPQTWVLANVRCAVMSLRPDIWCYLFGIRCIVRPCD